jgi:hypothetical protein
MLYQRCITVSRHRELPVRICLPEDRPVAPTFDVFVLHILSNAQTDIPTPDWVARRVRICRKRDRMIGAPFAQVAAGTYYEDGLTRLRRNSHLESDIPRCALSHRALPRPPNDSTRLFALRHDNIPIRISFPHRRAILLESDEFVAHGLSGVEFGRAFPGCGLLGA